MRITYRMQATMGDGEWMPRGYRVAWNDYRRRCYVCYPIGIHLVAMLLHRLWEWSFWYRPSALEKYIDEIVQREVKLRLKSLGDEIEYRLQKKYAEYAQESLLPTFQGEPHDQAQKE